MKLIRLFIIIISLTAIYSCEHQFDYLKSDIKISYRGAVGEDLLNPATKNALKTDEMELFYIKNGVKTKVSDLNTDKSKNLNINYNEALKEYTLDVDLNYEFDEQNMSVAFLEFRGRTDTIEASWASADRGSCVWYKKIWYNNQLAIEDGVNDDYFVVVMKNM